MRIMITGAAGFIGSALCRYVARHEPAHQIYGIDKLTYAANPLTLQELAALPNFQHYAVDVTDATGMAKCFTEIEPNMMVHLAAETHVDRSIDCTTPFVTTNIMGTHTLLNAALKYWRGLSMPQREDFRVLHVSTDEVYGTLGATGRFTTSSPHAPNSPYAATKAAAEDLARAWQRTFGLPVIIANCCNVYGAYQFPEKLIPSMILKALHGEMMPLYGTGDHVREWLYVDDVAAGLWAAITRGQAGEKHHLAAMNEMTNLALVQQLCALLDTAEPDSAHCPHAAFIQFVEDRPGHDFRYALDCAASYEALGWQPTVVLTDGLKRTIDWYRANPAWWQNTRIAYDGRRLGLL